MVHARLSVSTSFCRLLDLTFLAILNSSSNFIAHWKQMGAQPASVSEKKGKARCNSCYSLLFYSQSRNAKLTSPVPKKADLPEKILAWHARRLIINNGCLPKRQLKRCRNGIPPLLRHNRCKSCGGQVATGPQR